MNSLTSLSSQHGLAKEIWMDSMVLPTHKTLLRAIQIGLAEAGAAYTERLAGVAGGFCLMLVGDHGGFHSRRNNRISKGYVSSVETYLRSGLVMIEFTRHS